MQVLHTASRVALFAMAKIMEHTVCLQNLRKACPQAEVARLMFELHIDKAIRLKVHNRNGDITSNLNLHLQFICYLEVGCKPLKSEASS